MHPPLRSFNCLLRLVSSHCWHPHRHPHDAPADGQPADPVSRSLLGDAHARNGAPSSVTCFNGYCRCWARLGAYPNEDDSTVVTRAAPTVQCVSTLGAKQSADAEARMDDDQAVHPTACITNRERLASVRRMGMNDVRVCCETLPTRTPHTCSATCTRTRGRERFGCARLASASASVLSSPRPAHPT